jgi:L-ascorbate metabolism protein UlaG (beta-lactamase superfamily)
MIITYLGHSCFKIQDRTGAEGITLTTDPFDKKVGFRVPNFESDIVTISHDHFDHNNAKSLRGEPFVIDMPGEYDRRGVLVHGVVSKHGGGKDDVVNIMFRIEMDNISIAHLGDLGEVLNEKQLEVLAGVDILLVPVGGKYTLDAKKAVEVISQIEPRIIIPMHYKVGASKMDIEGVDGIIKELGLTPTEETRLNIKKKDLPQEDMELVVMSV